ncbi:MULTISPECIES: DUF885 family protein [unclassified Lysobacter]|uniref:DUF885 domain-containing protein n=1 Tax=unclassified Lysobacter TaxID=2635362 RepID=UPI001BECDFBA|nr:MULTISPECIES: DUF885 family protein [unclassified Lysobacter]MBT2745947.1 DUF885 family protein [Lysobacter sp. ISL-42]MBT2752670.1 DUF885 family protein [Lysobacter sp. ISL-50]MBT2777409.1 DUF885 family protein [Lysobacter sp. ISL-54]MBT2783600.1 DUF885 family protein [Lysobacter sp. ISL-52]
MISNRSLSVRAPLAALTAALSIGLSLAPAFAAEPAAAAATRAATNATGERFKALYTREWKWRQAQFAGGDDEDVQGQPAAHLPRVDPASQAARERYWTQVTTELAAIDKSQLSGEDPVNYEVFRQQIQSLLANQRVRQWEMPFNSDSAFWTNLGFTARRPIRDVVGYQRYLGQLRDIPRYFDEQIGNMRAGLKRGFSVPQVTLTGRDVSIQEVADAKLEDNLLYTPFKQMPANIPAAEQTRLRAEAAKAIDESVLPAYRKLLAFMRNEYMKQARTTLAAESMPGGEALYQAKIREFTTLDLTPAQIHQIGVEEVAKIRAQMDETIVKTGFKGSFPEFLHYLRTDPKFYPKTADELMMRASWLAKRVDGEIGNYIGLLPRQRFAIRPVPPDLAPFYTAGRGGRDVYLLNTYDLPSRPLFNLPALTLHESSPGHSLQGSLAAEQEGLPDFRRYTYISAYGEGWALYSEKLGIEMGMYDTPYDYFGYLTYQMWRASRLVVDTGIHHLGWTREQAQAFLHDNTALSDHEIETEVDRYIGWPGQALSYYLGEMSIVRSRAKAEQALGEDFDIRAFHDAILALGSVPLPVLEQRVDRFIEESRGKAAEKKAKAKAKS